MKLPVAVVLVAVVSAAISSVSAASPAARNAGATSVNRVWRDAQASLAVGYPDSWHVTTRNLTNITQPVPRFAIYSGASPRRVAVTRGEFTQGLRSDQVMGIVMEQTSVSPADLRRLPRRPHRFTVSRLTGVEGFGDRWVEFFFRDHGREFYVFVGVGKHGARHLPTLLHSLDTLRVGG